MKSFTIIAGCYESLLFGLRVDGERVHDVLKDAKSSNKKRRKLDSTSTNALSDADGDGDTTALLTEDGDTKLSFAFRAHDGCIKSVHAEGRYLATGSADESIKIFDLKRSKEMVQLLEHTSDVNCVRFYGKHLLSCGRDGLILVWDCRKWTREAELKFKKTELPPVHDLSIHPSGRVALSVSNDKKLRMWNLVSPACIYTEKFKSVAYSVEWSPSGDLYAIGIGKDVLVRDAKNNTLHTLTHGGDVLSLHFVTIGNVTHIVSGGEDRLVSVWELDGGKCVRSFGPHENRVKAVAFVDSELDGMLIMSASSDGCVRLFHFESEDYKPEDHQLHELIRPMDASLLNAGGTTCMSTSAPHRPVMESTETPPFYLYEFDFLNVSQLLSCYESAQKSGERYLDSTKNTGALFLYAALRNHERRVHDSGDALVFVVAAHTELSYFAGTCGGTTHEERQSRVYEALRGDRAYARCGGRRHLLACMSFHCNKAECLMPAARDTLADAWLTNYYALYYRTRLLCQRRVIVAPFPAQTRLQSLSQADVPALGRRDVLACFQGATDRRDGGLRQSLFALKDVDDVRIVSVGNKLGDRQDSFATLMLRSRFCLNPRGDAPSSQRLFDSVAAGCIPVIISDKIRLPYVWSLHRGDDGETSFVVRDFFVDAHVADTVSLPFEWRVDYRQFVIRIAEDEWIRDAVRVVDALRRLAPSVVRCMQGALVRATPHLMYSRGASPLDERAAQRLLAADNLLRELQWRSQLHISAQTISLPSCGIERDGFVARNTSDADEVALLDGGTGEASRADRCEALLSMHASSSTSGDEAWLGALLDDIARLCVLLALLAILVRGVAPHVARVAAPTRVEERDRYVCV